MRTLEKLWLKFLFVSLCLIAFSALAVSSMDKVEAKKMAQLRVMCNKYPLADICYDHPFVESKTKEVVLVKPINKPIAFFKPKNERERALVIADIWGIEVH